MSDEFMEPADLIDQASDWGTTISEAQARKGILSRLLMAVAFCFLALGSVLILPVLAGSLLYADSSGAFLEIAAVGIVLAIAITFKWKSGNLPRNALQIDYRACELRLGAERKGGAFVREQVIGFREIEEVYVDSSMPTDPALCIKIPSETVTLHFHQAEQDSLDALVGKILAARESARRAPVRSRIQSRILGFEASFHEAKQRIRTRIVTRTAN